MVRLLIGSILGGIAQFLVGAIAWVLIAGSLAYSKVNDAANADLQQAMARTLGANSGTYMVPWPETPAGVTMMGRGPVAMIFYHSGGSAMMSPGALLTGLVLSIVMLLLVGLALRHVTGFCARLKVAALFGVATTAYFVLSLPVYNFYFPWGWWVFLAVEELLAFGVGVFVLVRWFMPEPAAPTLH